MGRCDPEQPVYPQCGCHAASGRRSRRPAFDEAQFLNRAQLEALIEGLHKVVQRGLPISMVGAGLPQIAELAGDAKSYAERLFKFPAISNLSDDDAKDALSRPAEDEGASFAGDALDLAVIITGGYPYFIQELGYAVWTVAAGPQITAEDISGSSESRV